MSKEPFDRPECGDQKRPFTGWFISVDVIRLFDDRTINLKETILLAIILNYSKTEKGCYMSNERLGKELAVTSNHVSNMISNLKSLKLVSETGFDGRTRQLKVLDFRKAASRKTRRQHTGKPGGRVPENRECIYKDKDKGKRKVCGSRAATPKRTGLLPENWESKAAKMLHKILDDSGADLVVRLKVKVSTLAKQIARLSTEGKVSKEEIKTVFKWLREHYNDNHTPKIYKVADLFNNWGRIRDARLRWLVDNGESEPNGNGKIDALDVFNNLQILGTSLNPDQEDIDDAAAMLGASAGTFTVKDVMH